VKIYDARSLREYDCRERKSCISFNEVLFGMRYDVMTGLLAIVGRSIDFVDPTGETLHFASNETDDETFTTKLMDSEGLKVDLELLNSSRGISLE
jgi:hypothetical protein